MSSVLLESYRRRWGELATYRGDGANGPCYFCGDTSTGSHRSDRFVVWTEKTEGLGKTCAEHAISGVCWCRQCGKGGDTIWYLMEVDGLSFEEACEELGISRKPHEMRMTQRRAPAEAPKAPAFEGRPMEEPRMVWQAHAERMDEEARKALPSVPSAMRWLLMKHGITPRMARRYGLGFLHGENGRDVRFRLRSSFGLPAKISADGKETTRLAIRRGITIVSRDAAGRIVMFRVRRPNPDVREHQGKFYELEGGSKCSYHLPPAGVPVVRVYMIVEGEMDAMLLHAVAGETIGLVATRSCTNRPDEETHKALRAADLILVTLDSDGAGQRGAAWWLQTYRQARLYPVPGYKDPGDAYEAGFDLRCWLEAGLPRSLQLAPPTCDDDDAPAPLPPNHAPIASEPSTLPQPAGLPGSVEPLPESVPLGGGGKASTPNDAVPADGACDEPPFDPEAYADECGRGRDDVVFMYSEPDQAADPIATAPAADGDVLTPDVMRGLRDVLPAYFDLDAMPRDVLTLAVLWRGVPVHYRRLPAGGYSWDVQPGFRKRAAGIYDRFIRLATSSPDVADWLSLHTSDDVWSGNFLQPFGKEA